MAPAQDHEPMDPNSKIMIKGRRTKRPRTPSSPLALSAVSDEGTRSGGVTTSSSSSATSSEYSDRARAASLPATEEEEDMANCLILLAQGGAISIPCSRQQAAATATAQPESSTHQHQKTQPAAAAAGVTVSVYECKTCNRCFPSFQALGGHRAGHKKPKLLLGAPSTTPSEDKRMASLPLLLGYDHDENPGLSLRIAVATKESKTRAHECTICGSGFVSGQALGGHMRRHRAILGGGGGVSPVVVAGGGRGVAHYDPVEEGKKVRTSLPLDLNLPAPDEDQDHNHRDQQNKYVFSTDDNKSTLVFSASPMVDCHY